MDQDEIIVVQETEYTGAGKHPMPQLTFAKQNGVEVLFGKPDTEGPGKSLVFPKNPGMIKAREYDLVKAKKSYIHNCVNNYHMSGVTEEDIKYSMDEIRESKQFVMAELEKAGLKL